MRKPTTVLLTASLVLFAVIALFVTIVLRGNADERNQINQRLRDRAAVSAALTSSIFGSSTVQSTQAVAKQLGGAKPRSADLVAAVRNQGSQYAVLLDASGRTLAATPGVTRAQRRRLQSATPGVRRVLGGRAYEYSSSLPTGTGPVYEGYARIETPTGSRVLVRAYPAQVFTAFFAGFLKDLPGNQGGRIYVVDTQEAVVASPSKSQPVGGLRDLALGRALQRGDGGDYGDDRVFAATGVDLTELRVVLTARKSTLYAGVGGASQWLLLALMVLVGLAALALTWRNALGRAEVRESAEALAHSNAELRLTADALEGTNADLETANDELKRSNGELEQFASVASHDLQEPLRKVQSFGDQLERRFGEQIPAEGMDYVHRMRSSAARMSSLIEDLLLFSRVTTHARPPREVNLAGIAREVAIDLDNQRLQAHGTIEIGELPQVVADPLQMRQLLQNLIGNALKFHRPGIAPHVTVHGVPGAAGTAVFTVADNGIGFDAAYEDRIFRVFERLHPRNVYEGTGIGLALCRKIVERHGGTIAATSVPDEGSMFTVSLPQTQARPGAEPDAAPAEPARGERETAGV